jgi:hypothetical protein
MKNPNISHFDKFDNFFFNGEKKKEKKILQIWHACVLVQISVPRYFFIVLNSELKGQEKKISFEILSKKLY